MQDKITDANLLPSTCIDAKQILPVELRDADMLNEIILEVYNGWPGKTGEERVIGCIKFISERIPQYSNIIGKSDLEFLTTYAKARRVNYTNWFNDSYLPDLSNVIILDTIQSFRDKFPSGKYICPCCDGETTDYQECNSGIEVDGRKCNWKVYGLFGDLGKGVRVIIKDKMDEFPRPVAMFKPIELAEITSK